MKSFFTISFFVTLLFTAGTAFSYQCDIPAPPKIQPCTCSLCQPQKSQCKSKCNKCDKRAVRKQPCKKKIVHKNSYQCKTTCTAKTEQVTTVQCKLCGTHHPKGVDHYCNKVQCRSCGQVHQRGVAHHCGVIQCRNCGIHHQQGMEHRCGEVRCQFCGVHYHPSVGHHCRARCQQYDCSQQANSCRAEGKQCSTRGCRITHKETKETRWHNWFKNQG